MREVNTEAVDNFYSPYRLYQTMNQMSNRFIARPPLKFDTK